MEVPQGMIDLQRHSDFERLLRPKRPTEEGFDAVYAPFVVVCFSASWCGPCKRMDKKTLVAKTPGVKWLHCDVDVNDDTLKWSGCSAIPSFICLRNGDFVGRLEGPRDANHVLEWLSGYGVKV